MRRHKAPWSKSLIVASALGSGLIAAVTTAALSTNRSSNWVLLVPAAVLVGAVVFTIRGYTVGPDAVLIHRLLWATRLRLSGLKQATYEPDAARGGLRTSGNGGLFAVTGWYYNRRLGKYRAFLTDPRRAVVLRYETRTVVLSPKDPERFLDDLELHRQTV